MTTHHLVRCDKQGRRCSSRSSLGDEGESNGGDCRCYCGQLALRTPVLHEQAARRQTGLLEEKFGHTCEKRERVFAENNFKADSIPEDRSCVLIIISIRREKKLISCYQFIFRYLSSNEKRIF
jgi:hypothetical protein